MINMNESVKDAYPLTHFPACRNTHLETLEHIAECKTYKEERNNIFDKAFLETICKEDIDEQHIQHTQNIINAISPFKTNVLIISHQETPQVKQKDYSRQMHN